MIYDYRSDDTVQDTIFDSMKDFIEDIVDEYYNLHRDQSILIYVPSEIGREIVYKSFNVITDLWLNKESHNDLLTIDGKDVIITLASDGMVFIEDARGNSDKFLGTEGSELAYVYDAYSKKDIDTLASNDDSILIFGFRDDNSYEDIDNSCNHICKSIRDSKAESVVRYDKDDDGNLHGFTASKSDENGYVSYSYYSSDKVSKRDVDDFLGKFGFRLN